jgi:hypothetical protein
MKTGGVSNIGRWYRPGHGLLIVSTILCSIFLNGSASFAQSRKIIKTGHTRERVEEYINDSINPLGLGEGSRRSGGRNPAGQGQVDVEALRPLIRGLADNMRQLTFALNEQMGQSPGLRRYYAEALRLSGVAENIHKRAASYGVDGAMLDDLQQLDADWRELAYRLESVRELPRDTGDLLSTVTEIGDRIRQQIKIQPQFDRRQLNIKAAGLAADLDNLQEDIASELGRSQDSQYYRRSINRVRQVVLNLVSIVRDDRTDNSVIVDEYKQFETLWSPLVAKLRMEDDRYIERGLRRVAISSGEIQQLLLMPQRMDQSQYVYLAKALKKDIDQFFERTPLILVMRLPNAKQALPVADQFYNACARFTELVNRSQDINEIVDSYRSIEQAKRAFFDVYRDVDSDRALSVLSRIDQTVSSLRSSLQIQRDDFDNQSAGDLAASVQNFTDQIAFTCKRWLDQDNQPFATQCLQEAVDLAELAGRLHDDILDGKSPTEVRDEMADVYDRCRRIYAYLEKCNTEERQTFARLTASLSPAINELRTMILQ